MKLKWNIEHVYFYLVSFIALILIIVGGINITRTAIAYVTPIPSDYQYSFDKAGLGAWEREFGTEMVEQEIARFEAIGKVNAQRSMLREIISGLAYILIALPVYLYHWRKIPKLDLG
ncbi:MAG: hypothetical protein AB1767_05005 [Bacillota bacterium]